MGSEAGITETDQPLDNLHKELLRMLHRRGLSVGVRSEIDARLAFFFTANITMNAHVYDYTSRNICTKLPCVIVFHLDNSPGHFTLRTS